MCPPMGSNDRAGEAGFTLVEVLVALVIVAVTLTAIGSLRATTVRGTRSLDEHFTMVETTRAIEGALPDRNDLKGSFTGVRGGYDWRVDALPFRASFVDAARPTPWIPQAVVITVQSPDGTTLRVRSIRLRRRTSQ